MKSTTEGSTTSVSLARSDRDRSAVMKNQIIVDLNQRLREIQNELEVTNLEHKKMVTTFSQL